MHRRCTGSASACRPRRAAKSCLHAVQRAGPVFPTEKRIEHFSKGRGDILPPLPCVGDHFGAEGQSVVEHTVSLKKNSDFRRLYAKGKSAVSPLLVIYCRRNRYGYSRVGFVTGTKLGNAVARNRVRRRLRAIYRTNEAGLKPSYDIILVARTQSVRASYWDIEKAFLVTAGKLHLLTEEKTSC